jgi:5-methylcytosine-specific restriction protein A
VREGRYCPAHAEKARQRQAETAARYDKTRDQRVTEFYHSPEWEATRKVVLARDHGLCQDCLEDGRVALAEMVHHEVEVKADWSKRLSLEALVSLCQGCHNKRHGRG